ncbi:MAG: membrane protein [Lysobacteraceae bacterium]|nr:MAG: membrane protein [Xanthomonadaceae bacterium]
MGKLNITLIVVVLAVLAWSAINPSDWPTWALEAGPVIVGLPLLLLTGRQFPLTQLLYFLLAVHAVILVIGAHYTYAHVPVGFWVQDMFDLSRNHYDRLGHLAQGFVPAILAREILLRTSPLRPGKWLFTLVLSVCLAFSAFYELLEWWAALIMGEGADEFLGTQGDPWDTQADMFLAMTGAILAQLSLSRLHDKQLARLP